MGRDTLEATYINNTNSVKYKMTTNKKYYNNNALKENENGTESILDYYKDTVIFVTGGTGFVGKVLIEKLLRTCKTIETIYVLIRPKKGKNSLDRLEEMLSNPVFNVVKKISPELLKKIKPIEGDVKMPNLGINDEDIEILIDTVNIVFHSAATIKFNESLCNALTLNTFGSKQMVDLSCKMKHIKSFVYVSTAYANVDKKFIDEVVYKPVHDPNEILEMVRTAPEQLDKLSELYCAAHPNTYTYSKALSEYIMLQYSTKLPISIVRPSVVTCSWKEPVHGFIDGMSLMTGVVTEICRGSFNSFYCEKDAVLDLIPVDIVVNTLITAAWHMNYHKTTPLNVYNCTSGSINGITCGKVLKLIEKYGIEYPGMYTMFYPDVTFRNNRASHKLHSFISRTIPACLYDLFLLVTNKKAVMYNITKKMNKASDVMAYFLLNEWDFGVKNMRLLNKAVRNTKDGHNFDVDLSKENNFSWAMYIKDFVLGIKIFIMKEDTSILPQAKARLKKIYWTTKILQVFTFYVFFKLVTKLVGFIGI